MWTVQLLKSSSHTGHPTWTSGTCGMQDLGLNGRRVAICGKGSTSFLGFSWRRRQNFSSALAFFVEDEWVTQNLGALFIEKNKFKIQYATMKLQQISESKAYKPHNLLSRFLTLSVTFHFFFCWFMLKIFFYILLHYTSFTNRKGNIY